MNSKLFLPAFIVAVITVAGCKPANETPAVRDAENETAARRDAAKQETKEAVQVSKDYAYAQKAEFAEKMRAELASVNKEMDELSAKVEKSSDATKAEAKAKMEALREKSTKLNEQLDKVKDSTEDTWGDVKSGFKKGYDELKESVKQARQWLSDKIAP